MTSKYERHQQVSREQARQKLQNAALLCAYIHGPAEGYYAICSGHIDGFRSDYAVVHWSEGDIANHAVRAFFFVDEHDAVGVERVCQAVRAQNQWPEDSEEPLVAVLTDEEKEAARLKVREALEEEQPADAESWLAELCGDTASDLTGVDWSAVVEALRK